MAAAVLALGGAGLAFLGGGGGPGPTPAPGSSATGATTSPVDDSTLRPAWRAPATTATTARLVGSWDLPGTVVRGDHNGLSAFDTGTGRRLWRLARPAGTTRLCTMSPVTNTKGLGTVLFVQPGRGCSLLVAVSTSTGRTAWTRKLDVPAAARSLARPVTFVDETTVVADVGDSPRGLAAADGKPLWRHRPRAGGCRETAAAGLGDRLVLADHCPHQKYAALLSLVDARTGRIHWSYRMSADDTMRAVVSTSPVVAEIQSPEGNEYLFAFRDNGRPGAKIAIEGSAGDHLSPSPVGAAVATSTAWGKTLVTEYAAGGRTGIAAFDLLTGRRRWAWDGGVGLGARLVGLRSDPWHGRPNGLVAAGLGAHGSVTRLYALRSSDGRVTELDVLPATVDGAGLRKARLYIAGRNVFVVPAERGPAAAAYTPRHG